MPRLKDKYRNEVVPGAGEAVQLRERDAGSEARQGASSAWASAAPTQDAKLLDAAIGDLTLITGQKPAVTRAKKSISNFKVREGMRIGAKVTLRGAMMYEFLDRLFNAVLPRIRDFSGIAAGLVRRPRQLRDGPQGAVGVSWRSTTIRLTARGA